MIPTREQRRLSLCNERQRPLFEKIYAGKAAMIECIEGQCLDCMGFSRQDVIDCASRLCPLWKYRPYQTPPKREVQTLDQNSEETTETQ